MEYTLIKKENTAIARMPAVVRAQFDKELATARAQGLGEAEATQYAYRMIQHAGWYVTATGWKQLAADLRGKVNIRFAEQQPNGRYLVRDVDVFYPNAVKLDGEGKAIQFSTRDTSAIIANTNRAIAAGGQKTAVTRQHPTKEQKDRGIKEPSFGEGFNFKDSPRGKGWIRCDLADLDPAIVEEWRTRRATGLSAGFVGDGAGLNRRIGHVAVLSEAQALSALPATEIFSVQDQLCFSADEADFTPVSRTKGINTMPKSKELCGRMSKAFSAMSAAYAAMEAGEEGADAKLTEAQDGYAACQREFTAELGEGGNPDAAEDKELIDKEIAERVPAAAPAFSADEDLTLEQFAADPCVVVQSVNALRKQVKDLTGKNEALEQAAVKATAAVSAKSAREMFSADLGKLGDLDFSAEEALADFDAADGNPKMIERIKARCAKAPVKAKGPADFGQFFSAEDFTPMMTKKPEAPKPIADIGAAVEAVTFAAE